MRSGEFLSRLVSGTTRVITKGETKMKKVLFPILALVLAVGLVAAIVWLMPRSFPRNSSLVVVWIFRAPKANA